jgi:hypothetical protein
VIKLPRFDAVSMAGFVTLTICGLAAPLLGFSEVLGERSRRGQVANLISDWHHANSLCRGSAGARSNEGCASRARLDEQLRKLGFCYGEGVATSADAEWLPCRDAKANKPPGNVAATNDGIGIPEQPTQIQASPAPAPTLSEPPAPILQQAGFPAIQDHRPIWLVDETRGCVPGTVSRATWQLAQLRSTLKLQAFSAVDGDVIVIKIFYVGRVNPVAGVTVYVSDAAYCQLHFGEIVSDMSRVSWGQESRFLSWLSFDDETQYLFPS